MEGESGSLAEPGSPRVELFALQQYSRKMTALEAPHLVIGRLRDYFARRTNWQRRLWNPGTVTVLQETLEAVQLLEGEQVALGAVEALARTAERRAGPDSGIGTTAKRKAITETLRKVSKSQMVRYQFEYLLRGVGDGYLQRWSEKLRDQPDKIKTEEASRLVAGHLLGLGFSPDKLHRWSTWLYRQRQPQTLADLFEEAEALARSRKAEWVVFIPFRALGRHGQTMPDEWLDLGEASRWLLDHVGSVKIRSLIWVLFMVLAETNSLFMPSSTGRCGCQWVGWLVAQGSLAPAGGFILEKPYGFTVRSRFNQGAGADGRVGAVRGPIGRRSGRLLRRGRARTGAARCGIAALRISGGSHRGE